MFKKTFIVVLFSVFLYANTSANAVIEKVEDGYAYAKVMNSSLNSKEFENGFLILKDIGEYSIIVARANFVSQNDDILKLDLYTFSDLKQSALPVPMLRPQSGDKVILNTYVKNTLLIAPSKKDYNDIKNIFKNYEYFDTNVLAAKLYKDSQILPTRNDLRNFCKTWVLGSIMYANTGSLNLYECSSLKKIASMDYQIQNNENINFYSDLSKKLGEKIDYFSYYDDLFKEKE